MYLDWFKVRAQAFGCLDATTASSRARPQRHAPTLLDLHPPYDTFAIMRLVPGLSPWNG